MNKVKSIVKNKIKGFFEIGSGYFPPATYQMVSSSSQLEQKKLMFYYQQLKYEGKFLPNIKDVGFRVFSQNDEDGILLYIFSLIGITNRLCLDIAFACPYGANATNLICNHNFNGLLVCGGKNEQVNAVSFFKRNLDTCIVGPKIVHKWITKDNINSMLLENGINGEIDFFSLDMDGVDYWVWKELSAVQPRVVVVEFHNIWGSEKSVTVPYASDFDRFKYNKDFMGASLTAFVKLGKQKGYRLVGCNKYCFNAFFIKNGIEEDLFPELSPEECFSIYAQPNWVNEHRKKRLENVKSMSWLEV
ncbi:hypothetical protein ACFLYH_00005 [Candidatus Dependentiae bacterium]